MVVAEINSSSECPSSAQRQVSEPDALAPTAPSVSTYRELATAEMEWILQGLRAKKQDSAEMVCRGFLERLQELDAIDEETTKLEKEASDQDAIKASKTLQLRAYTWDAVALQTRQFDVDEHRIVGQAIDPQFLPRVLGPLPPQEEPLFEPDPWDDMTGTQLRGIGYSWYDGK